MKQIPRLDHAECVHHADAIGEYNRGFHAATALGYTATLPIPTAC